MTNGIKPLAIKEGLSICPKPHHLFLFDLGQHLAHRLDRTVALVWEHCDGKTTIPQIAKKLSAKLGRSVGEAVIWVAIERLRKAGLVIGASLSGGAALLEAARLKIRRSKSVASLPQMLTIDCDVYRSPRHKAPTSSARNAAKTSQLRRQIRGRRPAASLM